MSPKLVTPEDNTNLRGKDITQNTDIVLTDPDAPITAPINKPITGTPRKGEHYNKFVDNGLAHTVAVGEMTQTRAAELLEVSQRTISGYLAAYIEDKRTHLSGNAKTFRIKPSNKQLLDADNFPKFRAKYFRTHKNEPYYTKPFHMRWIRAIIHALNTGGKLTILSPPRHGKTELLIHFVIWLIIKNPNIRIIWIGGNEDIAKDAVGLVMRELEENEKLKADFLGPDEYFKPQGRGSQTWNNSKITVATRTIALKSATLRALGRGNRVLSLDADLIITDDIDDADSVVSPATRGQTQTWWDQNLTTRKEDHTAWLNIGSRQHPDDIHNKTLTDGTWETIVEQAYDPSANLPVHETPQDVPVDHKETFCEICYEWDKQELTLFPELRPMRYLMTTMKSIGRRKFSMIYLNIVDESGVVIFPKKHIDQCKNPNRVILDLENIPVIPVTDPDTGITERYSYNLLVGGLDPSGTAGYQAAIVWAFNTFAERQYLIDIENEKGGGIAQARSTIKHYFNTLKLRHWVIEENLYQGGITKDHTLMDYCSRHGIVLEGHLTYMNKWDPEIGVTAMAPLFEKNIIDLPYGDSTSQAKVDEYEKQLRNFEGKQTRSQKKKGATSDIVMAGWFPQSVYRRHIMETDTDSESNYEETPYPDTMMGDVYERM